MLLWRGAGTMGLGSLLWFRDVMRMSGTAASRFMAVMPLSAAVVAGIAAVAYSDVRIGDDVG
ncbi:hypothetical protein [Actinoplanes philippinensis]|uniref:hypothetical protein n=1 Tax=Actinoplanes philippinensis TaxID=35752 RepID=UPI0033E7677C